MASVVGQRTASLDSDEDDEAVEVVIVDGHGLVQIVQTGGEIGASHQFHPHVLHRRVMSAVVGKDAVVDAFGSLVGVQLAQVALLVAAVEIVDAIGDVARLLDFGHETTFADGVDASGGDEKHIALSHRVAGECFTDGMAGYHRLVFLRGDGMA